MAGTDQVQIGIGKSARRAYGFDDITVVPSRRTRCRASIGVDFGLSLKSPVSTTLRPSAIQGPRRAAILRVCLVRFAVPLGAPL